MTDGALEATDELDAWATNAAAAGDDDFVTAAPFSDRGISVEFETYEPEVVRVGRVDTEGLTRDEVGRDAALSVAQDALDGLETLGLTRDAFASTPVRQGEWTFFVGDTVTMQGEAFVDRYFMHFGFVNGGIEVSGPSLEVEVSATGKLQSFTWRELDITEIGSAPVTLDDQRADDRFRELVLAEGLPEGVEANFGVGHPAYRLGSSETTAETGVRWINEYNFSSEGGSVSFTEIAAVSMTDENGPLIPIAP